MNTRARETLNVRRFVLGYHRGPALYPLTIPRGEVLRDSHQGESITGKIRSFRDDFNAQ